ncbi:MAG TPA: TRAM domain-containing protein [Nocardioidaceae bacterium]|nr:TRAM domain-containing protein [Nocardioidaceae bacterium]
MRHRPRQAKGRPLVGERYTVEVGPVAHGGHFVARHEGRVLFVRHALPGERVVVEVTEGSERDKFLRADVVEVLERSPDRVTPPCPYSGPGLCGGCDFQHVSLDAQRALKAAVVREQLQRLAGLDVPVTVEAVPGDEAGLRWRTRIEWARTRDGHRGLRKHRSHDVVPVEDCMIARTDARAGSGLVTEHVRDHDFRVDADGFWQVHPGAPEVLVAAVLEGLEPKPGERALDLYSGVGLFSAFLAEAVGVTGHVLAVEGNRRATVHATQNLSAYPWVSVRTGRVDESLGGLTHADVVVLDPPREGAKRAVVQAVAGLTPRAVAYVACDPAALARDTAIFAEHGYVLDTLRAFDLFPMTHHVECVAILRRA